MVDLSIHVRVEPSVKRQAEFQFNGLEELYQWLFRLHGFRKNWISDFVYKLAREGDYSIGALVSVFAKWRHGDRYLAREVAREVGLMRYSRIKTDLFLTRKFAQEYDSAIRTGRIAKDTL